MEYLLPAFKDMEEFAELITDVYPILKLILQFNQEGNKLDYSFRNILSQKLSNISQSYSKYSATDFSHDDNTTIHMMERDDSREKRSVRKSPRRR